MQSLREDVRPKTDEAVESRGAGAAELRRFRAADGRRLAFRDSGGPGPAVLCLAGLTRNSRDFDDLAALLAPRYRVIRLDSRGRGGSDRAEDPIAEYSVPVEAGDAIALLDHLGIRRVALIGTSRGGILSMAIAGGQPERVSAVVLNDVGAVIEAAGLLRIMATLGRAPRAQSFEEAAETLCAENGAQFPDVPKAEWLRHARRLFDVGPAGAPVLAYDPKLRLAVASAMDVGEGPVVLWPLFEALKAAPVLVIRGENSDILTAATADRMRQEHPGLQLVSLKNRGHAPFLNEPEAAAAIDAFLAAHAD